MKKKGYFQENLPWLLFQFIQQNTKIMIIFVIIIIINIIIIIIRIITSSLVSTQR